MRKHSVRKWLHALLDLLPLVVIPVFMVYSHRHQIDSYSVQRTEYNTIHMQQNVVNGLPSSLNNWELLSGASYVFEDDTINIESDMLNVGVSTIVNLNALENDKVLFKLDYSVDMSDMFLSYELGDGSYTLLDEYTLNGDNNTHTIQYIETFSIDYNANQVEIYAYSENDDFYFYVSKVEIFNLTQMFGIGNEPTIEEFNSYFPNDYYAVDSNAVAYVPYTRTYNDTDIGSQIFYSLYNSVDKYFNCNKLFSFNGVYNWINFNLFGGNAPLMVDVVYQIIVYEFFMDLIFLIYSVFMFIIDFASNFLEYSFSWSRRGGR